MTRDEGSATLLTLLLVPILLLVFASVVDLGMLRHAAARARIAADLAAVVAVNDQDDARFAADGRLVLAPDAELVARDYLTRNLTPLAAALAATPAAIARSADVAVWPAGGVDPLDGVVYQRPAVRIAAEVPLRTIGLAPLLGPVLVVRAWSVAMAR